MNILLTFTGFHDPYSKGLVESVEQPGPILSLLNAKSFNHIIIFSTANTEKNTNETAKVLSGLYPDIVVEVRDLAIDDPIDYLVILKSLRLHIHEICKKFDRADYFISVSSGTPTMHACWVLLAASGEIPAQILQVRPRKFVTKNLPVISIVDFSSPEFPTVRSNIILHLESQEPLSSTIETVIAELGIVGDHPSMKNVL